VRTSHVHEQFPAGERSDVQNELCRLLPSQMWQFHRNLSNSLNIAGDGRHGNRSLGKQTKPDFVTAEATLGQVPTSAKRCMANSPMNLGAGPRTTTTNPTEDERQAAPTRRPHHRPTPQHEQATQILRGRIAEWALGATWINIDPLVHISDYHLGRAVRAVTAHRPMGALVLGGSAGPVGVFLTGLSSGGPDGHGPDIGDGTGPLVYRLWVVAMREVPHIPVSDEPWPKAGHRIVDVPTVASWVWPHRSWPLRPSDLERLCKALGALDEMYVPVPGHGRCRPLAVELRLVDEPGSEDRYVIGFHYNDGQPKPTYGLASET